MNSPVKKSVGVFQNRGVCLQAFPRCPTPTPSLLLFLFCSRLNFRATRIFTRATHSSSFARERLLRRLRVMGFACFGDFVSRSVFCVRQITPAVFNTVTISSNFWAPSPQINFYGPDRYITYTSFYYTPVNCYLLFMS